MGSSTCSCSYSIVLTFLQFGALVLFLGLHRASARERCAADDAQLAAASAFAYNAERVRPFWQELKASRNLTALSQLTQEAFEKVAVKSEKDQCLVAMQYDAKKRTFRRGKIFRRRKHECFNVEGRAEIFYAIFQWLQLEFNEVKLTKSFAFYLDVSDSIVISDELYELMNFPIIGFGVNPGRIKSLPVPEVYIAYALGEEFPELRGIYKQHMLSLPDGADTLHAVKSFRESMHTVFSYKHANIPWEARIPKAVYRGQCVPTADSDPYGEGNHYMYKLLRPGICNAVSTYNSTLIDIGMSNPYLPYCREKNPFFDPICRLCSKCSAAPALDRQQMHNYKYQVNIDGYGPTYDAIYWKLGSGSTVLHLEVGSPNRTSPLYWQWYSPLLVPGVHYIPVTKDTLEQEVAACLADDARCRKIAAASERLMQCRVNIESVVHYLAKSLQLIHDSF